MSVNNILCFGDSNTWGFVPGAFDPKTFYMERYPISKRWPGVMRTILGTGYHVVEEGLNGRTTNVEYPDLAGRSDCSRFIKTQKGQRGRMPNVRRKIPSSENTGRRKNDKNKTIEKKRRIKKP